MASAPRFVCFARSSVLTRARCRSKLSPRALRVILCLTAGCLQLFSLGCNTYNPYLGATPTVSSSISFITPSGANAGGSSNIALTVCGAGFVANSIVTWNGSGTSVSLQSSFVSANTDCTSSSSEMIANIPSSLLATPGTFSIGVIAPGPTSGNNAGNNISNFVPFIVFPASGSSSAVAATNHRISTPSPDASGRASTAIRAVARYQPIIADSADADVETATGIPAIFLRDSCLGAAAGCTPKVIAISVAWNGAQPNGGSSSPSVTADGRFVVFASEANNLVKHDSNGWSDVFLRDTCLGATSSCAPATIRLSMGADRAEANGPSFAPAISPDGRFVAFNSSATNLVGPGPNAVPLTSGPSLFLRDTCFGAPSGCVPTTSRVIPASALPR